MKTSFICTVLNEEEAIESFLLSFSRQTRKPDEIVIVDGGSRDGTIRKILNFQETHKTLHVKLFRKRGNRAVGRNFAIRKANHDIILLSDAGCLLSAKWVHEISKPFLNSRVDVVSGYYRGKSETVFQKCLIPYVLVMPDKLKEDAFLPSTRSMAIKKSVLKQMGWFPKEYSHNEDYVFAKYLQKESVRIGFAKKAIVYWIPVKTLKGAFIMFFRFAVGDAEAGILRPKVVLIIARYVFALILFSIIVSQRDSTLAFLFFVLLILYLLWAIAKNYKYVKRWEAIYFLPLLQITSDIAVLSGTCIGLLILLFSKNERTFFQV
ncbi:MAG: glycosyltransferase [Candidatus Levybacteria bacterium]|nr:glycosyltransferase [Candidatus Levybacteria bacterium]